MNNKRKIIIFVLSIVGGFLLLIIIVVGYVIYQWNTNTSPCIPEVPIRVEGIPKSAEWKGGCDGGHWFEVVEINNENYRYRIRVYFDYNGEIFTDEYFTVKEKCQLNYNKKSLIDDICFYNGYTIRLKDHNCSLIPIKKREKEY